MCIFPNNVIRLWSSSYSNRFISNNKLFLSSATFRRSILITFEKSLFRHLLFKDNNCKRSCFIRLRNWGSNKWRLLIFANCFHKLVFLLFLGSDIIIEPVGKDYFSNFEFIGTCLKLLIERKCMLFNGFSYLLLGCLCWKALDNDWVITRTGYDIITLLVMSTNAIKNILTKYEI